MAGKTKDEYDLLDRLFDELWPLPRSITGPGIERSLELISEHVPLEFEYFKSGSKVFDWTVPPEWNFRRATLTGPDGKIVCDTDESNLHVLNFSVPVDVEIDLVDLEAHLYSLPDLPEEIPYVTSYYKPDWGFCLPHSQRQRLRPGVYRAKIESSMTDGRLPIGIATLPGVSEREVLVTSYLCHPSLANNELSGPLALVALFHRIRLWEHRYYTYRFVLNPETIGALCFLSRFSGHLRERLEYGLTLTCLGGPADSLRYKASFGGLSVLDHAFKSMIGQGRGGNLSCRYESFSPLGGSDERQYGSVGFRLPMGQVARTVYGQYDGYHNSRDTKEFMTIASVLDSVDQIEEVLQSADGTEFPVNLCPYGEPQLSRRNLYPSQNSSTTWHQSSDVKVEDREFLNCVLMILALSDGMTPLDHIEARCMDEIDCSAETVANAVDELIRNDLLTLRKEVER